MAIKEVNLSGTLNLQDDEYRIGLDGFTELINLRQENGKLVQRYGTGSPATINTANIDNMEMFVDRKLTGVRLNVDGSGNNMTLTNNTKTLTLNGTMANYVIIPGYDNNDLRNIFKAGDTVFISGAILNDGLYVIASVGTNTLVFTRGFNAGSDAGPYTSGPIYISFVNFRDKSNRIESTELITNETDRIFGTSPNWTNGTSTAGYTTYTENQATEATEGYYFTDNYLKIGCASEGNVQYATLDEAHWTTGSMTAGKTYRLSFSIQITAISGTLKVGIANDSFAVQDSVTFTETTGPKHEMVDFVYNATNHKKIIIHAAASTTFTAYFDNFSLKEANLIHMETPDDNSFDGKAWISTYNNASNKVIGMINPTDYTDKIDLKEFSTGLNDHIRAKAYTDAVRFNCGFENNPTIFKYIKRHPFNGMLKEYITTDIGCVARAKIDHLYPHWVCEDATPAGGTVFTASQIYNTQHPGLFANLNLRDNDYTYKFIPEYDGNQEVTLEDDFFTLGTNVIQRVQEKKDGKFSHPDKMSAIIQADLNLEWWDLRTSAINVYRSTNNGPYYKIKRIYTGENDTTQKSNTFHFNAKRFCWTGNTTPASDTLDDYVLVIDGYQYHVNDGTGGDDWPYTDCNMKSVKTLTNRIAHRISSSGPVNAMKPYEYFGDIRLGKFGQECKETPTIFANNGEAIGGSPEGGWYFANATELACQETAIVEGGGSAHGDTDYAIGSYGALTLTNFLTTYAPITHEDSSGNDHASNFNWMIKSSNDAGKPDAFGKFMITDPDVNSGEVTVASHIVSGWIHVRGFDHPGMEWKLYISQEVLSDTATNGELMIASGSGGDQNQNIDNWRYFQYEYTPASTDEPYLYVRILSPDGSPSNEQIWLSNFSMRLQGPANYQITDGMKAYCGTNVMFGDEDFFDEGYYKGFLKGNRFSNKNYADYPVVGKKASTGAEFEDSGFISDNADIAIRVGYPYDEEFTTNYNGNTVVDASTTDGSDVLHYSTSNYQFYSNAWNGNADGESLDGDDGDGSFNSSMGLWFIDTGLPDGPRHPFETAKSLDVKHKYSTMLNGRQFLGNVKITSEEEIEEHPNFVMFSDVNSPDIIPITNYIQLQDLQGGEIVGIETLMSDLVVFMTNGVFRLSVPSNNPASWSLVEAHQNVGALHDKGIVKTQNGIFFLSKSDIFYLDSGFSLNPISDPIRDTYQAGTSSSFRLHHNVKYSLLYLTYTPSTTTIMYIYDLKRGVWYQETHLGLDIGYKEYSLDNNGESILIESGTNSQVRKLHDTTVFRDKGSQAISWSMKTGKQILNTLDLEAIIRRVNTITTHSGTDDDLTVYTDTGNTAKSEYLDGIQSTRVSRRGKYVQIKIANDTAEDNQGVINHVDVDYE
tara:strand:- start:1803 stop:5942 length:4140 start_codon:yes stop_codon:yes gene_type:complete